METAYNLYRKGNTWNGRKLKFPWDLTGARIVMEFKTSPSSSVIFEYKTDDNTLLMPDPSSGEFWMAPRKMEYPAATYIYSVKIYFENGKFISYNVDKLTLFDDD
jgi:hypothetical protein